MIAAEEDLKSRLDCIRKKEKYLDEQERSICAKRKINNPEKQIYADMESEVNFSKCPENRMSLCSAEVIEPTNTNQIPTTVFAIHADNFTRISEDKLKQNAPVSSKTAIQTGSETSKENVFSRPEKLDNILARASALTRRGLSEVPPNQMKAAPAKKVLENAPIAYQHCPSAPLLSPPTDYIVTKEDCGGSASKRRKRDDNFPTGEGARKNEDAKSVKVDLKSLLRKNYAS